MFQMEYRGILRERKLMESIEEQYDKDNHGSYCYDVQHHDKQFV